MMLRLTKYRDHTDSSYSETHTDYLEQSHPLSQQGYRYDEDNGRGRLVDGSVSRYTMIGYSIKRGRLF